MSKQLANTDAIRDLLCVDIKSIITKMNSILPQSPEATMTAGLLMTAAHMISNPVTINPVHSNGQSYVKQLEGYVSDDDSDPSGDPSDPSSPPKKPRQSLVQQWGGKLPRTPPEDPRNAFEQSHKPPKSKAKLSKSGKKSRPPIPRIDPYIDSREVDEFDIFEAPGASKCGNCGEPIVSDSHPEDMNLDTRNGVRARVLCDLTRVYPL